MGGFRRARRRLHGARGGSTGRQAHLPTARSLGSTPQAAASAPGYPCPLDTLRQAASTRQILKEKRPTKGAGTYAGLTKSGRRAAAAEARTRKRCELRRWGMWTQTLLARAEVCMFACLWVSHSIKTREYSCMGWAKKRELKSSARSTFTGDKGGVRWSRLAVRKPWLNPRAGTVGGDQHYGPP